jgi:hypothetical protein
MATGEGDRIMLAAAGLGVLVAIPLIAKAVRARLQQRRSSAGGVGPSGPS